MDTSPDSQALPRGTHLHEFVIERVLGYGGFGITYLARDTSLGRQVVIKENLPSQFAWRETATGTVRPRHTSGGDLDDYEWSMKNFLREAETLASLDHPGIVRVLRKFETNGTAYFVMPFVEGLAFDTLIEDRRQKNSPFSEEELRGLLERMLDALAYMHDRGIYHRDIKPGNILITNDGIPVLIDFGSARQRLGERSMTVIESPGYTPFEQLQSRGNVGPWSDLYALAGTLVKAITGEAPPKANDRAFDDPFVPLAELKAAFSSSFLQCLDCALRMKPADRWQDAGEWLKVLREPPVAQQQQPVWQEPKIAGHPAVSWKPESLAQNPEFKPSRSAPTTAQTAESERKTKPVPWIVAACLVLGLFAIAKTISENKDENRPVTTADDPAMQQERKRVEVAQTKEAEARTAKAEQEREALETAQREAEIKVQAQEAARREAEAKAQVDAEAVKQEREKLAKAQTRDAEARTAKTKQDELDKAAGVKEEAVAAESGEIRETSKSTENSAINSGSVAVLYNSAVMESRELAEFYRKSRNIPVENLVALDMPTVSDISRESYEKRILKPLRAEFERRSWWKRQNDSGGLTLPTVNRIRVIVMMRGVPLRIQPTLKPVPKPGEQSPAPDPQNPVAGRDEASVDSELVMFGVEGLPTDGVLQNKFYKSTKPIADMNLPFLVLTARIDAPTIATCKRMIRDAVEVEKTGLWGRAYVDIANKFPQGDQWLEAVAKTDARAGVPTVVDRFNDTLPKNYPMTEAAQYFGWSDSNVNGPFLNPLFRFRKGAVAIHLDGFSAEQLSDGSKNWSGALLAKGATVTVGNVYEPYLHLTHDFSILHQKLLAGYTWGEACWMAMPVTSWQGVVLGDPLYQPFLHFDGSGMKRNEDIEFRALRAAAIEWKTDPREMGKQLEDATERMKSGILAEAIGLDLLSSKSPSEAGPWFRKAQEFYSGISDKIRMDFHLVAAIRTAGEIELATSALREAEQRYGSAPEAEGFTGWLHMLKNSKPLVVDPKPKE